MDASLAFLVEALLTVGAAAALDSLAARRFGGTAILFHSLSALISFMGVFLALASAGVAAPVPWAVGSALATQAVLVWNRSVRQSIWEGREGHAPRSVTFRRLNRGLFALGGVAGLGMLALLPFSPADSSTKLVLAIGVGAGVVAIGAVLVLARRHRSRGSR